MAEQLQEQLCSPEYEVEAHCDDGDSFCYTDEHEQQQLYNDMAPHDLVDAAAADENNNNINNSDRSHFQVLEQIMSNGNGNGNGNGDSDGDGNSYVSGNGDGDGDGDGDNHPDKNESITIDIDTSTTSGKTRIGIPTTTPTTTTTTPTPTPTPTIVSKYSWVSGVAYNNLVGRTETENGDDTDYVSSCIGCEKRFRNNAGLVIHVRYCDRYKSVMSAYNEENQQEQEQKRDGGGGENNTSNDTENATDTESKQVVERKRLIGGRYNAEEAFQRQIVCLHEFKQEFGHIRVPIKPAKSKYLKLNDFLMKQRKWHRQAMRGLNVGNRMHPSRVKALTELGMEWNDKSKKEKWYEHFQRLQDFHTKYGHTCVSIELPSTSNNHNHNLTEEEKTFKYWVTEQRKCVRIWKGRLEEEERKQEEEEQLQQSTNANDNDNDTVGYNDGDNDNDDTNATCTDGDNSNSNNNNNDNNNGNENNNEIVAARVDPPTTAKEKEDINRKSTITTKLLPKSRSKSKSSSSSSTKVDKDLPKKFWCEEFYHKLLSLECNYMESAGEILVGRSLNTECWYQKLELFKKFVKKHHHGFVNLLNDPTKYLYRWALEERKVYNQVQEGTLAAHPFLERNFVWLKKIGFVYDTKLHEEDTKKRRAEVNLKVAQEKETQKYKQSPQGKLDTVLQQLSSAKGDETRLKKELAVAKKRRMAFEKEVKVARTAVAEETAKAKAAKAGTGTAVGSKRRIDTTSSAYYNFNKKKNKNNNKKKKSSAVSEGGENVAAASVPPARTMAATTRTTRRAATAAATATVTAIIASSTTRAATTKTIATAAMAMGTASTEKFLNMVINTIRMDPAKAYAPVCICCKARNIKHEDCLHVFPECPFALNAKSCTSQFISLCTFLTELKRKEKSTTAIVTATRPTTTTTTTQLHKKSLVVQEKGRSSSTNTNTTTTTISILAPPGKLGIGLQSAADSSSSLLSELTTTTTVEGGTGTGTGGAIVTSVRPSGVMAQQLWKGDHIIAIDGKSITQMDMKQILDVIAQRIDYRRHLTVLRRTIPKNNSNENSTDNNNNNNNNNNSNHNHHNTNNCHNSNGGLGLLPSTTIHASSSNSSSSSSTPKGSQKKRSPSSADGTNAGDDDDSDKRTAKKKK